jgi:hypothetical protein
MLLKKSPHAVTVAPAKNSTSQIGLQGAPGPLLGLERPRKTSRISPGEKSEPEFAVFDSNEASREVLEAVRNQLEDGNIEVVGNLAMPRWVNGDRVQLQQVILNLVMNAVDAMRETTGRPRGLFISSRPRTRVGSKLKWGIQGRESTLEGRPHLRTIRDYKKLWHEPRVVDLPSDMQGGAWRRAERLPTFPHGTVFEFTVRSAASADES